MDFILETGQGIVFDRVTATIPEGSVVAVTGRAGVGKSALLLALTGRMRGVDGQLTVEGVDALRHPGRVRKNTSVARIDDLVEPEALMPAVMDYARKLADSVAPGSARETKRQIYRDLHRDAASAVTEAERLLETMIRDPDYKEGVKAWMEKRAAAWQG